MRTIRPPSVCTQLAVGAGGVLVEPGQDVVLVDEPVADDDVPEDPAHPAEQPTEADGN